VTPKGVQSMPFVVRVKLDDEDVSKRLPAGSAGTAAIFTEAVEATHVIRKVLLRQLAILNYVNPVLTREAASMRVLKDKGPRGHG
jgi:hypothetical protein